ncbi:MIP family Ig-specific serine endopeptidase [Metamycoplasma canadense]|uniref:DUF31 domain-containing protein n=1 Tax=Metamycoplasma canadense TaxID=29554 RepID=A0A077LC70_9BACT|nr:DUF31 family protein [Metamycoplasma canadense]BAP39699.1 hypothetical protein MCAN360_0619 [Metamycoplasma canadense]
MKKIRKILLLSPLSFVPVFFITSCKNVESESSKYKINLIEKVNKLKNDLLIAKQELNDSSFNEINTEVDNLLKSFENITLEEQNNIFLNKLISDLNFKLEGIQQLKIKNKMTSTTNNPEPLLKKDIVTQKDKDNGNNNLNINSPVLPPSFLQNLNNKKHEYPDYVKNFKKIDANIIYNEIYDRTFSIKFATKHANGNLISNDKGTGWLLDYHKYTNAPNKYKLFIATNLHVISNFSNSLDDSKNKELNYYDPVNDKVIAIGLGKSKNKPTNFEPIANKNGVQEAFKNNWIPKYYTNSKELENYDKKESILDTETSDAISAPKIVFAAFDFMRKEAIEKYQKDLKEKALSRYDWLKNQNKLEEDVLKPAYEHWLKSDMYVPISIDMAIFEVDVDLTKANSELKKWVEDAINGVDSYINRLQNTALLPNQDKEISKYMLTVDYVSAFKKYRNEKNLYNLKNIFIGGYPSDGSKTSYWMTNNPIERESETLISYNSNPVNSKTFAYPLNNYESKLEFGNNLSIADNVWRRVMASWYGNHYNINFSSLYYGASGSIAYNEFGQMIGIYDAVTSSVTPGDLLQWSGIAPFIQSDDIESATGDTLYAYNLIDGTDQTKFKNQKNSFRQNLRILYPNGFEDGNNKTKLFENGF